MRTCAACGSSLEGKRPTARTCSDRCRDRLKKRAARGSVIPLAASAPGGDGESPLVAALVRELDSAGRTDTAEGQQALFLARRLTMPSSDTAAAVASLSKEYRAARLEALKGVQAADSRLDELRARRDAKRGA